MNNTVNWNGHQFQVFQHNVHWSKTCGGIYMFCRVNARNQWEALYVGQCDCFCDRIPSHERWAEALALGATHVHALVVVEAGARDSLEAQLIQLYQPPLNTNQR